MVQLLKIKQQFYRFVGRFEVYVMAAVRFAIAFTAFHLINTTTGYMDFLSDYPIALACAVICAFLPAGVMVFLGAVLILLQFYALSPSLCLVTAIIFIILFCVYLRFTHKKGLYVVLTPLLSVFGVPYVMPVTCGLFERAYTVIAVLCGEFSYFILKYVSENSALFSPSAMDSTESILTQAVTEIFTNQEMYLYLCTFVIAAVVVYCVRKFPVDHAHMISVAVGIVVQLVIIGGGEIYLGTPLSVVRVVVGCAVSLAISAAVVFMTYSLDYSRVENVQFEDDEYYYYVKAVPKAFVLKEDKQVKQIHRTHEESRKDRESKEEGQE